MAKSSTARDERFQRGAAANATAREREATSTPAQSADALPANLNRSLTFNELKASLKTTDGNLSVHARKLEEADYIVCTKSFDGRLPKTEYRLTAAGRRALERYLNHMEALIRATREG
jgi:DNA-binding MarR family transcriptional regulator